MEALDAGKSDACRNSLWLVGLETPAAVEQQWLKAVARYLPVTAGAPDGSFGSGYNLQAVALPDRRQEMEWVAAQVLELAGEQRHALASPGHHGAESGNLPAGAAPDLAGIVGPGDHRGGGLV